MTEEQKVLSRRAVACKGWRGMPGMRAVGRYPDYPVRVHAFGESVRDTDDMQQPEPWGWQQPTPYGDSIFPGPYLPDLTDPATLGCLLALVREVRQEPTGFVVPTHAGGWSYYTRLFAADWYAGDTEAEALVAALESAP